MATASDCLTTALLNVNGLTRNFDGIKKLLIEKKIDVLVLTHIGLVTEDDIQIEGFDVLCKYFEDTAEKDQSDHGVAVYIKKSLDWKRMVSYECTDLEVIWVNLRFPKKKDIFLGCCCRKEPTTEDYLNDIRDTMNRVSEAIRFRNIFFMGDFNVDWLRDSDDKTQLQQMATENGFTQIVRESTNDRNPGTCMDHIYTSAPDNCRIEYSDVDFSDHKLLYVTVNLTDAPGDDPGNAPGDDPPDISVKRQLSFEMKDKTTLALLNVNGLRNKIDFIRNLIQTHNINVLGLCGTRLDNSVIDDIEGFQVKRKDRNSHGGGVAIYGQKDIPYEIPDGVIDQNVEIICVEFSLPGKKPMLVACCYSPRDKENYVNGICNVMKQLSKEVKEKDIFLMGTFHTERYRDPEKERQLEQVANECGLTQIVAENCRALNKRTRMDHIYTNVPEICGPTERIYPTSADDLFVPVIPDQYVGPVKSSAGQFSDHGLFYVTVCNRPK